MNYALIIAVMLALIGTVYWLRPSPRQKHLSHLREQARQQGLKLKFHSFNPDSQATGLYGNLSGIFYTLTRTKSNTRGAKIFEIVKQQGWHQEQLPYNYSWHYPQQAPSEFSTSDFTQSLSLLTDELLVLTLYENQVNMLCSENLTANGKNYNDFLQFWLNLAHKQKSPS